jgi:hypothetical protein
MLNVNEKFGRQAPGMLMAMDGIVYTRENESTLIDLIFDYMITRCGYSKKTANYYLNYDEDFIGDNLQCLPRG